MKSRCAFPDCNARATAVYDPEGRAIPVCDRHPPDAPWIPRTLLGAGYPKEA